MTDAELTVIFGHIDTLVPLHQGQFCTERLVVLLRTVLILNIY